MRWIIGVPGRRSSAALAGFLAIALPAWAEDTASPPHAAPATPAAASPFEVTIPTIDAVNSSIDEPTLRAILSGDFAGNAEALSNLTASSIRIPELRIHYALPDDMSGDMVLRDIDIGGVTAGVAQSLVIGGFDTTSSDGSSAKFGKVSADLFDIGGLLGFYGLVAADASGPPKLVYRNLVSEGGTLTTPEGGCKVGGATVASFKARPLKVSFTDFFALAEKLDAEDARPTPEMMAQFVDFYVDIVDAFETSPFKFAGFDCSGTDNDGVPFSFTLGGVTVGAFAHGHYPEVSVRNIRITAPKGEIGLGEFIFKSFDITGTLSALKSAVANGEYDEWFKTHYRDLIPAFEGLAFSGLKLDLPDSKNPGQRIKSSVENFDLSLGDYINGIPTDVSMLASHIFVTLPEGSDNKTVRQMTALGIKDLDLGYDAAVKWDSATNEIRVRRFSISGANMGSIVASSVLGQATRDLFSPDSASALMTALGMTLKRVKIDVHDAGLADLLLASSAREAGKGVAEFRRAISGMVQGVILLFMGSAADAPEISTAVGKFLDGAKSLSITLNANDAAGISFEELSAAQDDPTALAQKVTIDAEAR